MRLKGFSFIVLITLAAFAVSELLFSPTVSAEDNEELSSKIEIQEFADNFFKKNMNSYHIPGAVLVVVKDGRVILSKGYGYADLKNQVPVSPERTVFRVASISKLFTSTALLQLKDQNKLGFHEDINKYLKDINIENKYATPVTIHHLLTHTAGFDEKIFIGNWYKYSENIPFYENAKANIPPLIREPGLVTQYSNFGMQLAGCLVQDVSGEPFNNYMERHVLRPLKMNNSSFRLTKDIINNMAQGYYYDGRYTSYRLHRFYGIPALPAAGLNATGLDMANFIIANLQRGQLGNTRILSEESVKEMHSQQFSNHPKLPGICYGFMEDFSFGQRLLEHGGWEPGFASELVLIPEENSGYFIAVNVSCYNSFLQDFKTHFMYKFYPPSASTVNNYKYIDSGGADLKKYEGVYSCNRVPQKSLGRIMSLLQSQELVVKKSGSNFLSIGASGSEGEKYYQIGPNKFKKLQGKGTVAFRQESDGTVSYLFVEHSPSVAYSRLRPHETRGFHLKLLSIIAAVLLTGVFAGLLSFLTEIIDKLTRQLRNLFFLLCSINILYLVLILVSLYPRIMDINSIILKLPAGAIVLLYAYLGTIPLTCWAVSLLIYCAKAGKLNIFQTIYYSIIAAACTSLLIFLHYWATLGPRF